MFKKTSNFTIEKPEQIFRKLGSKFSKTDIFAFWCGFLFCIFVHFFAYTNTLFSHDSIELYNKSDGIANGRFFVCILFPLIARMNLPWVIGLFTSFFAGLAVLFLRRELRIKSKMFIVLLAGVFVGYPSVISYHCYFSSVYIYMFAILAAILCVYFIDTQPLLSVVLMVVSLSSYQAFVGLALSLCIIKLIIKIRDDDISFKQMLIYGVKYVFVICISMLLYYVLWKFIMLISNTEPISYRGYDDLVGNMFSNIFSNCVDAYQWAIQTTFANRFELSTIGYIAMLICNIFGIILSFWKVKKDKAVFNAILLLMLPLAMSIIYVLSPTYTHILMEFPFIAPLLLFISHTDKFQEQQSEESIVLSWTALLLCAVLIFQFAITANTVYLKIKTQYDNSISYATRLLDRIEQTDGFNSGTEIVIVGVETEREIYDKAEWAQTITKRYLTNNGAITYPLTLTIFLEQELNTNLNITTDKDDYIECQEVKALSSFPAKNCMTWIDGKLIVKISYCFHLDFNFN